MGCLFIGLLDVLFIVTHEVPADFRQPDARLPVVHLELVDLLYRFRCFLHDILQLVAQRFELITGRIKYLKDLQLAAF
ncbi:hypothetical protein D3C81_1586950 [compost metagenome]